MPRRMFVPKRVEVIGGLRKLHNKELQNVQRPWGEKGNAYRILAGKPEVKIPLGIPRYMWEDNIEMDLIELGCGIDWIVLAQDRDQWRALLNMVMNLRVP
jgi:hypothetical protein